MGPGASSERGHPEHAILTRAALATLIQAALAALWVSPLGFYVSVGVSQRLFGGSVGEAGVLEDVRAYFQYAEATLAGQIPYRDTPIEYPIGALPLFLAPRLIAPTFEIYRWAFAAQMGLFLAWLNVLAVRFVSRHEGEDAAAARLGWLTLALAPMGVLLLTRFDLAPAAMAVTAVSAWGAKRPVRSGVWAGLGTLAKLFPAAAVLPLFCNARELRHDRLRLAAALVLTVGVGVALWFGMGGRGAVDALSYHTERGLEIETVWAGLLMLGGRLFGSPLAHDFNHHSTELLAPGASLLARLSGPVQLAVLGLVAWRAAQSERADAAPRLAAAGVVAFAGLGKVLSPQYLLWIVPMVALIPGRTGRRARGLALTASLATVMVYPLAAVALVQFQWPAIVILNVRNLLLLALLVVLLVDRPEPPR